MTAKSSTAPPGTNLRGIGNGHNPDMKTSIGAWVIRARKKLTRLTTSLVGTPKVKLEAVLTTTTFNGQRKDQHAVI